MIIIPIRFKWTLPPAPAHPVTSPPGKSSAERLSLSSLLPVSWPTFGQSPQLWLLCLNLKQKWSMNLIGLTLSLMLILTLLISKPLWHQLLQFRLQCTRASLRLLFWIQMLCGPTTWVHRGQDPKLAALFASLPGKGYPTRCGNTLSRKKRYQTRAFASYACLLVLHSPRL